MSLASRDPCRVKLFFQMSLFQVYLVTVQHRTAQDRATSALSEAKLRTSVVNLGSFFCDKTRSIITTTRFNCQTKYTRCIYGKNWNKLCVTRTEKRSLQKQAVCPQAIKVSVCTNLPMRWMCSFFPVLLPALAPSKDQRVDHVLTLNDAWPLARGTEPGVRVFSLHEAD